MTNALEPGAQESASAGAPSRYGSAACVDQNEVGWQVTGAQAQTSAWNRGTFGPGWLPRNVVRHAARDATRVLVLAASDIVLCLLLLALLHLIQSGSVGMSVAWTAWLFPQGLLRGPEFLGAVLLALALVGAYGAGDARNDGARLLAGSVLAVLVSLYHVAWVQGFVVTSLRGFSVTVLLTAGLTVSRAIVNAAVRRVRPRAAAARTIVVAHSDADWRGLATMLRRVDELAVVERISLDERGGDAVHPRLRSLPTDIETHQAETVLLWGNLTDAEFAFLIDVAVATGCRLLAGARTLRDVEPRGVWIGGRWLVELTPPTLRGWQLVVKRGMDVLGAALGLLVLAPLMVAISVAVRLDSPGPALFSQRRVGARGRVFRFLKFRSMRVDAEDMLQRDPELGRLFRENAFKIPEDRDPRLTRLGRLLRKTSLDELPQLINVLRGEMSLVGPRPIEPGELEHYGHYFGDQGVPVFLSVKPGITGAWAINGRSRVGYPDRARLELEYIRTWSILQDLRILLGTIPAVLRRRGAH
ncbi:MAG TPA: exopolysaccharide biosynthesis polyprenyl glycosylphosphotransferase [Gemmatimonadaceae bacterium]|nr:exopolysaccharide biosynthesis polyprenyl glycosylphosphotransferase [Gemmatimonadaceae bacterium]